MKAVGGVEPIAITPTSLELIINLAVLRLKLLVCIVTPVFSAMTKLPNPSSPNLDKLSGSITKSPPANNKEEADICPLSLNINFLLVDWILDCDISNPPILPSVASTEPLNLTLPMLSKWKLLELISIWPCEALKNDVLRLPTKNSWVCICNSDGFDLNLKKLSLVPNISKPTPWYSSPLPGNTEPLKNIIPPLPLPTLALKKPV